MHCQASKVILRTTPCKTALRLLSTPPNYAEYLPSYVSLGIRSGFAPIPNLSRLLQQLLDNALVTDSLNCNLIVRLNSPIPHLYNAKFDVSQSKMSNCQLLARVIVRMIRQT